MHLTVCCPYCGKIGSLPDGFNKSSAKCPGCHRLFTIAEASSPQSGKPSSGRQGAVPAPPVESGGALPATKRRPPPHSPTPSLPVSGSSAVLPYTANDVHHEESVFRPAPSPGRPFWKDPIVLIGTAVPTFILIAFFGYLHFQWSKEHLRQEIIRVKEQGDRYLAKSENDRAFERYDSLLRWVGNADPGDEQSRAALEIVRRTRDRLLPEVTAEQEKRQQAAIERARLEEMSRITVTLKGDAWITRKLGTSDIIRGLPIILMKQQMPKAELAKAIETLKIIPRLHLFVTHALPRPTESHANDTHAEEVLSREENLYSNLVTVLDDLSAKPDGELIDVMQLYAISRTEYEISRAEFAGGEQIKEKPFDFDFFGRLDFWPKAVAEIKHYIAYTNVDGKYRLENVQGGRYYLYSTYRTAFSIAEWMIPLELDSSEKTVDLFNANASLILNKADYVKSPDDNKSN